jgi:hypothetical protein
MSDLLPADLQFFVEAELAAGRCPHGVGAVFCPLAGLPGRNRRFVSYGSVTTLASCRASRQGAATAVGRRAKQPCTIVQWHLVA